MRKRSQLWLPKFTEFEHVENYPQPHLGRVKAPKKYEIFYHPLDLRYRGRIGKWIEELAISQKIDLNEFLSDWEMELVLLYFYPQGKKQRWLNQTNVLKKVPEVKYWQFREKIVRILEKIWNAARE